MIYVCFEWFLLFISMETVSDNQAVKQVGIIPCTVLEKDWRYSLKYKIVSNYVKREIMSGSVS